MVVRVRVNLGMLGKLPRPEGRAMVRRFRRWLSALSAVACALALWRLGYDLNWTGRFAISEGFFSHWQVWLATAVLLQILGSKLQGLGRGGGAAAS
jgi:hypothetical protein